MKPNWEDCTVLNEMDGIKWNEVGWYDLDE